jgi:D-alanine-D-alanine ligase
MTRRVRVGVVYGGRSGEHEVSLRSAATVIGALDAAKFEVVPIAITREGRWRTGLESLRLLEEAQRDLKPIPDYGLEVTLAAEPSRRALIPLDDGPPPATLDVVFPVLHGTYGEDGTVQGLLEMAGIPYVGAGVLASAVGMDKAAMRAAFRDAGIPLCRWLVTRPHLESAADVERRIRETFGFPCFVKPANLGSSVGISKVNGPETLAAALAEAASFDPKVVVEEGVDARELECGVIGNDAPEASVVGEIVPSHEFYDYVDKYVDDGARSVIPANLPPQTVETVRALAIDAFRAVDCSGLARVDFFVEKTSGRVLVNEINTMPGFTRSSMFPRLWEASGLPLPALVERLVSLALERHAARARRTLTFTTTGAVNVTRSSAGSR